MKQNSAEASCAKSVITTEALPIVESEYDRALYRDEMNYRIAFALYKVIDAMMRHQADLVEVKVVLEPLALIKG